MGMIANQAASR